MQRVERGEFVPMDIPSDFENENCISKACK